MASEFAARLMELFDDRTASIAAIDSYFDLHFTGSQFEVMVDSDPNTITANDIVAVSLLSVDVPARVSRWLLSPEGRGVVTRHLAAVPTDVDIWQDADLMERGGHLWTLWNILDRASWPGARQGNGMGATTISKLLAAKRPRLVPITDYVVQDTLPPVKNYWADFFAALADEVVRDQVDVATATPRTGLSLLRRIDISLWMRYRPQK